MQEQRNLILAIVVSVVILLGFQFFYEYPRMEQERRATTETGEQAPGSEAPPVAGQPGAPPAVAPTEPGMPDVGRQRAIADEPRIPINPDAGEAARLTGSISLRGGRIDDIVLTDYHEAVDPESPNIVLLSPSDAPQPYHANFGWVAGPDQTVTLPGPETVWEADGQALTPESPLTLTWDNGEGLRFEARFALDEDYMFTITQRVENYEGEAVTLYPYGLVTRTGTPPTSGFFILHEGPIGVLDGTLVEVGYEELQDEGTITEETVGGWIGITDKYWLTALVPDQDEQVTTRFTHAMRDGRSKYQADYLGPASIIAANGTAEATNRFFAGAKEVILLDHYEETVGIPMFDLAVDFGWLWFLTKPIFYTMHYLNGVLGNFGLAILLLTVIIKVIFFPLANKSYEAMSKLKKLQPEMMKLRDRYKEDKMRMNQEVMALYKREGANPLAGCLPILVQIPVFFALYKVLFVTIEMRHAPFFGWIQDLSAPDPTSLFNLFGLLPFATPEFLTIGVWPLLMGGTMFLQQKLNPAPADPVQARVMMMLPLIFIFLFATFPAGLVIYWTWNNVLSIAQQWVIMKRMGVSA